MLDDKNGTQNGETCIQTNGWFKNELEWRNILVLSSYHLYFVYACFTFKFFENLKTTAWILIMVQVGAIGVTGGAHRLWTHRAYKAKWPLRIILASFYATCGLYNLWEWIRDHRVHHKYVDTDADPHNSNRGFFFSHVGWVMMKKNSEVIRRDRQVDMSDVLADPIAMFTIKHFWIMTFMFNFLLPMMVPVYGWNETWYRSFASQFIRYIIFLNFTWTINSVGHIWGSKPYDIHINPTENQWVSIMTSGEGWHNYHHVFPWDYKASESIAFTDTTTRFIDFFEKVGWAYDLKQPSEELVKTTAMKKGDGSRSL